MGCCSAGQAGPGSKDGAKPGRFGTERAGADVEFISASEPDPTKPALPHALGAGGANAKHGGKSGGGSKPDQHPAPVAPPVASAIASTASVSTGHGGALGSSAKTAGLQERTPLVEDGPKAASGTHGNEGLAEVWHVSDSGPAQPRKKQQDSQQADPRMPEERAAPTTPEVGLRPAALPGPSSAASGSAPPEAERTRGGGGGTRGGDLDDDDPPLLGAPGPGRTPLAGHPARRPCGPWRRASCWSAAAAAAGLARGGALGSLDSRRPAEGWGDSELLSTVEDQRVALADLDGDMQLPSLRGLG